MAVFGELRMQLYQDESDARLDDKRQRKAMSKYNFGIQQFNEYIRLNVNNCLSARLLVSQEKKYVESKVCNLVQDYELASHSDMSTSIETESNLFDSIVYEAFHNDKETANSHNDTNE